MDKQTCVAQVKALIREWRSELPHAELMDALDEMSDLAMVALTEEREKEDEDDGA